MAVLEPNGGPGAPPSSAAAADDRPHGRDAEEWLRRLRSVGRERDDAIVDLHALLVGAARHALSRRQLYLEREGFDDLATEAADDALLAILDRLDEFRGESRFTTWAWKFGFYAASVAVRKRRWLGREIPSEDAGWAALQAEASPDGRLEELELLRGIRDAVDHSLTPHQREVFVSLALNQVPVDVLAARLGTNRGALYKTLHDARKRVRAHLEQAGLISVDS